MNKPPVELTPKQKKIQELIGAGIAISFCGALIIFGVNFAQSQHEKEQACELAYLRTAGAQLASSDPNVYAGVTSTRIKYCKDSYPFTF